MVRRMLRIGLKRLLNGQSGFTLVELLVALGVMSALGSVLVTTLYQMSNFTSRSNAQVSVSADLRNTFHWLAQDVKMANTTSLVAEFPTVYTSLSLNWTDNYQDASAAHSAAYSLVGTDLRRTEDGVNTHTVARNVTSIEFSIVGRRVTVTLTSTDDKWSDVTKQFSHYFYLSSAS